MIKGMSVLCVSSSLSPHSVFIPCFDFLAASSIMSLLLPFSCFLFPSSSFFSFCFIIILGSFIVSLERKAIKVWSWTRSMTLTSCDLSSLLISSVAPSALIHSESPLIHSQSLLIWLDLFWLSLHLCPSIYLFASCSLLRNLQDIHHWMWLESGLDESFGSYAPRDCLGQESNNQDPEQICLCHLSLLSSSLTLSVWLFLSLSLPGSYDSRYTIFFCILLDKQNIQTQGDQVDVYLDIHSSLSCIGSLISGKKFEDVFRMEKHILLPKLLGRIANDFYPENCVYSNEPLRSGSPRRYNTHPCWLKEFRVSLRVSLLIPVPLASGVDTSLAVTFFDLFLWIHDFLCSLPCLALEWFLPVPSCPLKTEWMQLLYRHWLSYSHTPISWLFFTRIRSLFHFRESLLRFLEASLPALDSLLLILFSCVSSSFLPDFNPDCLSLRSDLQIRRINTSWQQQLLYSWSQSSWVLR